MSRVLSHLQSPITQFPSLLFGKPNFDDMSPLIANALESFTLAAPETDTVLGVIGIENWVTQTAWISLGPDSAERTINADLIAITDFAFYQLGVRLLLAYTASDSERLKAVDELHADVVGELRSMGSPRVSIVRFTDERKSR